MAEMKMRVIRDMGAARCFASYAEQFQGGIPRTEDVYLCGECGIILERNLGPQARHRSLIRCPNCGVLNASPVWLGM